VEERDFPLTSILSREGERKIKERISYRRALISVARFFRV
jgi:hypothetical protein